MTGYVLRMDQAFQRTQTNRVAELDRYVYMSPT